LRQEFLEQVRLWNRIDELPTIEVESLPDGCGVKFWCNDLRQRGLWLLIDSYGGEVTFHLDGGHRDRLAG
jgi:hypothetical protein